MLKLRNLVDNQLGAGTTGNVLTTMPKLPGLEEEDLQDALEHVGLRGLVTHKHIRYVFEISAAFAGEGFGLCAHPENCDSCEIEEADMPFRQILAISLTNTSFTAVYTYAQSAFVSWYEAETVDFELGLENEGGQEYWDKICDGIVSVGREAKAPLDTLLLLGEGAAHTTFVKTLDEAWEKLYPGNGPSVKFLRGEDPLYAAARGAAEFAKRA